MVWCPKYANLFDNSLAAVFKMKTNWVTLNPPKQPSESLWWGVGGGGVEGLKIILNFTVTLTIWMDRCEMETTRYRYKNGDSEV